MKPDVPELAALFEVARNGDEPSEADRRRVTAGVAQRLALGAGAGAVALTLSRMGWAVAQLKTWGVVAVVMAGTGSGAYLLSSRYAEAPRASTAPAVAHAPPSAPPVSAPVVAVAPAAPTQSERQPVRRAVAPQRERAAAAVSAAPSVALELSRLARETAALRDANEALRSGAPARSLALLDEFSKQFPNGMLAQEALATRVSALCELGRVSEARALGTRFVQRYPRSPVAARVRGSCAGP